MSRDSLFKFETPPISRTDNVHVIGRTRFWTNRTVTHWKQMCIRINICPQVSGTMRYSAYRPCDTVRTADSCVADVTREITR